MKIYQVSFIDHEGNTAVQSFPSIVKAKKWIRENKDGCDKLQIEDDGYICLETQVFENIQTIEIERLTKKTLFQLLNR